jgi:hypothetical protein
VRIDKLVLITVQHVWAPLQADNVQRRARVRNFPRLYRVHGAPIPIPGVAADAEGAQGQEGGAGDGADAPDMWHLQQLARSAPDLELALPRSVAHNS